MAELLEAWTDSGVNRVEKNLSTSIVPKLNNNVNENDKTEVQNIEEKQATYLEQPKVDKVEKYQVSVSTKKHKNWQS